MSEERYTIADLYAYIREEFNINSIPETMLKHINKYSLQYNMTAKEIAQCICYYKEVKNGKLDPLYGLWFVSNVREAARQYFEQLKRNQEKQAAEAKKVAEYQDNNIIFNIKSLQHKRRQPKQLDLSEVKVEGESDGNN